MRLRQLQQELGIPVALDHRAFLLRPEEQERTFTDYHLRHRRAARELTGLPFDLPRVGDRYPQSSLPALEAAAWVKRHAPERLPEFDQAVFEAFFRECRDISSPEVLGDLAAGAGLDRQALAAALVAQRDRAGVWAEYEEALRLGINSIPTVRIGAAWISGAVPYAEYLRAAQAALADGGEEDAAER